MGTDNRSENSILLKLLHHTISNHSVLASELQMIQINYLCSWLFSVISVM